MVKFRTRFKVKVFIPQNSIRCAAKNAENKLSENEIWKMGSEIKLLNSACASLRQEKGRWALRVGVGARRGLERRSRNRGPVGTEGRVPS